MADFKLIDYETKNNVAYIHLNSPEVLNAMSADMGWELSAAVDMAANEARVLVLSGRGRAFCSGANLGGGGSIALDDPNIDMGIRLEKIFNPLFLKLQDYPIPFITSIRGPAVGFGCGLSLMGDIIIASKTAYFLQTFAKIGLVPDGAAAYLLSRAVGRVRAMEIMLIGEKYKAEQAHADGLITRLVDDVDLEEETKAIAEKLAVGPPISLKFIRQSAWAALDSNFSDQLQRERELQLTAGRTDDFKEGVNAFREKRLPKFIGK